MNLFEQLQGNRSKQFVESIYPKTGMLSPRAGFFILKSITYEDFNDISIPIATVNWKKSNSDYFIKDADEKIALRSLFHNESRSNYKTIPIEDLIGKHLYIDSMGHVLESQNKGMIKMKWGILEKPIEFIEEHNAGLHLFFGKATTLTEAWQKFEKEAGFDIAQYLEDEANGFDILSADILEEEVTGGQYYVEDPNDFSDDLEDPCDGSNDNEERNSN